ncbi:hypothetical protein L3X39_06275 [Sabulilitoribacter multivorans]|uniref:DUF4397 domain-containing protein n=1 Tax=Flaviramulus multivorans TaxID=1304750 RepID=A0ABS9III2_9FLAO|nr:hypothetical protein [Flaviramulus multivorans]MCF7560240.1 hypothetical protein [Flaviramulus multivorans]
MKTLFKTYLNLFLVLCISIVIQSCSKEEPCNTPGTLTLINNESFYSRHVYFVEDYKEASAILDSDLAPDYIIDATKAITISLEPGDYTLFSYVYQRRCSRCTLIKLSPTLSELEVKNCANTMQEFPDFDLDRN